MIKLPWRSLFDLLFMTMGSIRATDAVSKLGAKRSAQLAERVSPLPALTDKLVLGGWGLVSSADQRRRPLVGVNVVSGAVCGGCCRCATQSSAVVVSVDHFACPRSSDPRVGDEPLSSRAWHRVGRDQMAPDAAREGDPRRDRPSAAAARRRAFRRPAPGAQATIHPRRKANPPRNLHTLTERRIR